MNKSIKITLNYIFGPLVFILLMYSLYNQLVKQKDIALIWLQIRIAWQHSLLMIILVLMLFNWFWEALKWKYLLKPLQHISLGNAYKSILAGCTLSLITPNRIGEFGGRILFVKEGNRSKAVAMSVYAGLVQLWVTFLLGTGALIIIRENTVLQSNNDSVKVIFASSIFLTISCIVLVLLSLIIFRAFFFIKFLLRFERLKQKLAFLNILENVGTKEMLRIMLLSVFRYFTFILQYLLMLKLMKVVIEPELCIMLTAVFFLLMAVAPTIGLLELPVRASAGVVVYGLFSGNVLGIQLAVFGIWVINLVIPAIAGSMFMMKKKLIN